MKEYVVLLALYTKRLQGQKLISRPGQIRLKSQVKEEEAKTAQERALERYWIVWPSFWCWMLIADAIQIAVVLIIYCMQQMMYLLYRMRRKQKWEEKCREMKILQSSSVSASEQLLNRVYCNGEHTQPLSLSLLSLYQCRDKQK